MPERVVGDGSPRKGQDGAKYRRPASDVITRAARRAIRAERASFPSLAAFRAAVVDEVRKDEPIAAVGERRLRRMLVAIPGVRLTVRYTEKPDGPLPEVCPVCGSQLEPIRNRTLTGGTVELGRACPRCAYWTHSARRVPVRYTVSRGQSRRSNLSSPAGA